MQTYYRNSNGDIKNSKVKVLESVEKVIFNPTEKEFNELGFKRIDETEVPTCDYSTHTIEISYKETENTWQKTYTLRELTQEELDELSKFEVV